MNKIKEKIVSLHHITMIKHRYLRMVDDRCSRVVASADD